MTFFLSFIETLSHSIWQAALLLSIYLLMNVIERNYHPLQKRNFLYLLIGSQFFISVFTFVSFFKGYSFAVAIGVRSLLPNIHLSYLNNYFEFVFTIYLSIVLIKFIQVVFQWTNFKRSYRLKLVRPTAELKIFTEFHSNQLCLRKKVTIWFSHAIKIPVTFGFFKPVILLPISLINNITTEQAELIILHELAHIKSKDYLFNWFLLITETIYFFNPFIKIVAEKLKLEREKNCDFQVLNYQYGSIKYAETLYQLAQKEVFLQRFQLGVFKNSAQLLKRIHFFSENKNLSFKKINYLPILLVLFSFIVLISFLTSAKFVSNSYSATSKISTVPQQKFYQKNKFITLPINQQHTGILKENNYVSVIKEKQNVSKMLSNTTPTHFVANENEAVYLPVSLNENTDSTNEFIYYLENNKTTITQSYKLIRRNDTWVFEPLWMIKITKDSSSQKLNYDSADLLKLTEIQ